MWQRYINWFPFTCPELGTWLTTQACALTGNQTSDPLVLRPTLNPLSHTSQGYRCLLQGVKAALPNTQKQTPGGCQIEETKKHGPNERTEQNPTKRTK